MSKDARIHLPFRKKTQFNLNLVYKLLNKLGTVERYRNLGELVPNSVRNLNRVDRLHRPDEQQIRTSCWVNSREDVLAVMKCAETVYDTAKEATSN